MENMLQMMQDEFGEADEIQGEMMRVLLKRLIIIVTRLAKAQYLNEKELSRDKLEIIRRYNFLVETHFKKEHQVSFYAAQLHQLLEVILLPSWPNRQGSTV